MEPDALAFLRYQEDIFGVIRCLYLDQLIIFLQNNGLQSILADVLILLHRSLLDHAAAGSHKQIIRLMIFLHRDHGCNLLLRLKLQKIDDGRSARRTAALRDCVCLQTVDTALVGKEHDVVMGLG